MIKRVCSLILLLGIVFSSVSLQAGNKQVSDDVIYNNVIRKLATDDTVKGGGLSVDVKEGAVVLHGKVDSERKKDKAEHIVKKVAGVKSVDNQIQVVLK